MNGPAVNGSPPPATNQRLSETRVTIAKESGGIVLKGWNETPSSSVVSVIKSLPVTSADTNKIFEFSTAEGSDPTETTVNVTGTGFWKVASGKNYGMQFGVVTGNDIIAFATDEDGVSFQPFNTIPPDSFAIVTRVSDSLWLVAGGGDPVTIGPFIMTKSLLGGGDFYA